MPDLSSGSLFSSVSSFTGAYCFSAAIAIGKAERVIDNEEKTEALRLLCERFLPKYMNHFDNEIARSLDRTTIIKITLTEDPVGKCKP